MDLPLLAVPYDLTSSSPMELHARLAGRCSIVWIADLSDPALGVMGRLLGRSGVVVDRAGLADGDVAGLLPDGVAGVVAFTDTQLRLAATIADRCGLPGNPADAVARLNDKYLQRQAMLDAGLAVPRFCRLTVGEPGDEPPDEIAALRFPIVLKPLRGDSSRDVVAIEDEAGLRTALAELASRTDTEGLTMIAEEYLTDRVPPLGGGLGSYLSVESIVSEGRVVPLAITGKFPLAPPFRETGNVMPHPVDATEAAEVLQLSNDAALALGVRSGALHTEIKLTPDGPRVIEVNGRIGGGAIDVLYQRRTGRSLTELATDVALGRPLDAVAETAARHDGPFLYEYFVQPPTTAHAVAALAPLDALIGTDGVEAAVANKAAGDELDWRRGSQGYVLRVSGTAADLDELANVPSLVQTMAPVTYR